MNSTTWLVKAREFHNHHVNANQVEYDALNNAPGLVGPPIELPPDNVHQ